MRNAGDIYENPVRRQTAAGAARQHSEREFLALRVMSDTDLAAPISRIESVFPSAQLLEVKKT
jgi:hypothetical protein